MMDWARERYPKEPSDSDFVYKQTIKAKACDTVRGVLPAATISNVGIYGTGQAYEALLLRMRAHPLPEAQIYAQLMLDELRKVIPSFLVRVDRPDRGRRVDRRTSPKTRDDTADLVHSASSPTTKPEPADDVTLLDWDPEGEDKVLAAICYPHTNLPEAQLLDRVRRLPADDRIALVHAYVGERTQPSAQAGPRVRAHRLPLRRARRLRRVPRSAAAPHAHDRVAARSHRITATTFPSRSSKPGSRRASTTRWNDRPTLYDALAERFPEQAAYAVSLAYQMRYVMQMNAREAMHLCELRSSPQGHPTYRRIAQSMHRLIAEQAGPPGDRGGDEITSTTATAISNDSTPNARPKRGASFAAERLRALNDARIGCEPARSARDVARGVARSIFREESVVVDLHRRASVLVIVARHGLTATALLRRTTRRPRQHTTVGRELRRYREGAGRIRGFGGCPGGLSRERCDNPSARCRSGHPAAPPVSWTRPSGPPSVRPQSPRDPTAECRLERPANAALYSAPPRGCAVPERPDGKHLAGSGVGRQPPRFFSQRGRRAR